MIKIRKMKIDDYEQVYNLWLDTPGIGIRKHEDSKTGIEKYLRRNPATCFVAEIDDKIIGSIMSGHDGRRAYIGHTAVSLSERNKGIGTDLLNAAIDALKQEGLNLIGLFVFNENKIGNEFWKNKGFSERTDLVFRNKNLTD